MRTACRRTGPAILASNHISYLDPLVLAYLADRRHRRVRFLAKAELFEKRGLGWGLRQIGQIPVQRNSDDAASSLDEAVVALGRGECIAVFPEGTISLDLEPMAGKTGVARLAAASGVPVTPIGSVGCTPAALQGSKAELAARDRRGGRRRRPRCASLPMTTCTTRPTGSWGRSPRASHGPARSTRSTPGPVRTTWWVRAPETAVLRPAIRREAAAQ